jgi:hypothetical protein
MISDLARKGVALLQSKQMGPKNLLEVFIRRRQFRYNPEWPPALTKCRVVVPLESGSNPF